MKQKFYILATLIEKEETTADNHTLYTSLEKAEKAFPLEIENCREQFEGEDGQTLLYLPRYHEWRNDDGDGFSVAIEEVEPQ
jgi:hypothetical protein